MELLTDIFGILIGIVILVSVLLQKIKNDKTTSRFTILVSLVLVFLVDDFFCNFIEGDTRFIRLSYILNVVAFLLIDGIIIAFSAYLATLLGKVKKRYKWIMNPGVFITYLRIVAILILAFTGNLFIIDDKGMYIEQEPAIIVYVMLAMVLVCLVLVVIKNRASFSKVQLFAILVYLLLPVVGTFTEFFTELYVFTGMSLTVAILIIYAVIQSEIIERGRIREKLLEELSTTDLLTHLNNRRAYYNRLSSLIGSPIDTRGGIGVIFCDINGLKYTNDHYGHAEGDKLIVRFAELITGVFDEKDVYRISGDEFVVLVDNVSEEAFYKKADEMQNVLEMNDSIASLGSAFGNDTIEHLVSKAESIMYDKKREYYESHGIEHR